MIIDLINNIWLVFLDTVFWLLSGLLAAAMGAGSNGYKTGKENDFTDVIKFC